jgi:hypothetical protein
MGNHDSYSNSFGSVTGAAPPYPTTRSFFIKYYSIAFAILSGLA